MSHRETLKPGQEIRISNDVYTIHSVLSRGGSSLIYEASRAYCDSNFNLQLEHANVKKVILKELAPYDVPFKRMADGSIYFNDFDYMHLRDLFRNEIRNIAEIQNGNTSINHIPDMDAFGEYNGTVYIAMNHIKGKLLCHYIRESNLTDSEQLDLLVEILDIIRHLHNMEKPHFHLDLKPANFIVGNLDNVYLFDFGSVLIEDGTWIKNYTENYSSPEVVYNEMSRIGRWSDIYSVGAIFYQILTKKVPSFDLFSITRDEYYTPRRQDRYDFNPLLAKMLSEKISDRFQTIEAVLEAIRGLKQ